MPPFWAAELPHVREGRSAAKELRTQWKTPSDIFSVLLLLGGDVIHRALAQVAGSGLSPVSFSFGWVAYSLSALVSAFGENKLMPPDPDCKCKIINGRTGHARDNSSWILARMVRDFDHWRDPAVQRATEELLDTALSKARQDDPYAHRPERAGFVVSIYESANKVSEVQVQNGWPYWSGFGVTAVQLVIAVVPVIVYRDWSIIMVTAIGVLLSLISGSLPQWRKEKWSCRRKARHPYVLTRGNGSQHAIVITSNGLGFNLEDLASGGSNVDVSANISTRMALAALAAAWILLLITAAGIQSHTWYLLAVGSIGIIHNVYVAGAPMRPENFGIHLKYVEVISAFKTMDALYCLEAKQPGVGFALLGEFFSGNLRTEESEKWDVLRKTEKSRRDELEKKKSDDP